MSKRRRIIIVIVCLLTLHTPLATVHAQGRPLPSRLLVWQDTLFGIIDSGGNTLLPCRYNNFEFYNHPLLERRYIAAQQADGKWGLLDWDGEEVLPFVYTEAPQPLPNTPGWILVWDSTRHVSEVLDGQGQRPVFRFPYYINSINFDITYFAPDDTTNRNLPIVMTYHTDKGLMGCIDVYGNEVLPPVYRRINVNCQMIVVTDTLKRTGLMILDTIADDKRGQPGGAPTARWIHQPSNEYSNYYQYWYMNIQCILFEKRDSKLKGLLSYDGREILPPIYKNIYIDYFSKKVTLQDSTGMFACADEQCRPLTSHRYTSAIWHNPYRIFVGETTDSVIELVDTLGHVFQRIRPYNSEDTWLFPFVSVDSSTYQMVTASGKLLPHRFDYNELLWSLQEEMVNTELISYSPDGKRYGVIDTSGRYIVKPRYWSTAADVWSGAIFARRPSSKVDVFDSTGRLICSCWGVHAEGDRLLIANRRGQWALADPATGRRLSRYYDDIDHSAVPSDSIYWTAWTKVRSKTNFIWGKAEYLAPSGKPVKGSQRKISREVFNKDAFFFVGGSDCSCGELIYSPYTRKEWREYRKYRKEEQKSPQP